MLPGGDDDDLFRRALADAAPLKRRRPQPAKPAPVGTSAKSKPKETSPARTVAPARARPVAARAIGAGDFADMDRRTADRLRRGKLPIEARLDLHGMYQDAAHTALVQFVTESAAQGRRCVLVITGRGSREGSGVLRARLPEWLNQLPCRPHVLGFTAARPEHGRDGAFYVLLRRKREDRI
ncbi:MAG: DNA mismatch repair protein MutS [Rhodospirillaceae bacterium]|nr:DNA mismatch repair protein MutS [Rhodospirillaceae bacterium]